jgi:hypothetical protein
VLKKAGIVVAVTAAGLLAVTPLASAQGAAPAQVSNTCSFTQSGGTINAPATGGSSLFGVGGAAANVIAPVTAPVQAGNCTAINVSDLFDVNSGNTTTTVNRTRIVNSFNRFRR